MPRPGKNSHKLGDIVRQFGGHLIGKPDVTIENVATLAKAQHGQISFFANSKYLSELKATQASAVILSAKNQDLISLPRIVCDNPYAYFAKVSDLLNPKKKAIPGIHPTAVVDASTQVAKSAEIGPFVHIAQGAIIGENSIIHAGCRIGENVKIGTACCLYPNVVVYHECQIGNNAILHSGAIIGADGFGIAEENQIWIKIPQIGRVIIGNNVEIGASTTVDRGAIDDTVIEEGVKLDNQIQVGHNVRIGAHTAIAGCVAIAGSTVIGKHCKIGGASSIVGHIEIADYVNVSACTLITKSIEQKGAYTGAYPFSSHKEWLKNASHLRHLDDLAETIKLLEKKITDLERK
jgi:UDP-3-O-[3-hydroxymyristoyl] glucosamine N-acyltransferase